uniref:Uncharacterized protein n=1 Tax=Saimiri boliviensis boliviensis TaxID=39432 RepID=A0A2K6TDF3_SAIBB
NLNPARGFGPEARFLWVENRYSIYGLLFLSQKAGFSGLSFFPPEMLHQGDKKCKIISSPSADSLKAVMLKQSIRCVLIIC